MQTLKDVFIVQHMNKQFGHLNEQASLKLNNVIEIQLLDRYI